MLLGRIGMQKVLWVEVINIVIANDVVSVDVFVCVRGE